jgi:hypothetical protein
MKCRPSSNMNAMRELRLKQRAFRSTESETKISAANVSSHIMPQIIETHGTQGR